ncbi:MAG TPA: hypothetical protein ENH95_02855 [Nitrosopumilus sp.]|nr:hypothetical protein [Nitrosopumilus sp.]
MIVNLVPVEALSDQHLKTEYQEIIELCKYLQKKDKYKKVTNPPKTYHFKKGCDDFFHDKIGHLYNRHWDVRMEMAKRGFKTRQEIKPQAFEEQYLNEWEPSNKEVRICEKKIVKGLKDKSVNYQWFHKTKKPEFFEKLMQSSDLVRDQIMKKELGITDDE